MATIIVGSARKDERGKLTGGKAGDQKQTSSTNDMSGEVSMQPMYTHSKGWYILRPKTIEHANAMADGMKRACNNPNIGYDQNDRDDVVENGIDTDEPTDSDCSALVREVVKEATGVDPGNFYTGNEADVLEATGLFYDRVAYVSQAVTPVYNGDVLVTKTKGHTVIVVSGNPRTEKVNLEVDGKWGAKTTTRLQEIFGTTVDGKVSNQDAANKEKNPGLQSSTFDWKKQPSGRGSKLIKAMQKWAGMPADKQNGEINEETIRAFQKKLGTKVDGYVSKPSSMVKALQRWANEQ